MSSKPGVVCHERSTCLINSVWTSRSSFVFTSDLLCMAAHNGVLVCVPSYTEDKSERETVIRAVVS